MTISTWILCGVLGLMVLSFGIALPFIGEFEAPLTVITTIATVALTIGIFVIGHWWQNNTASGIRGLTDQRSELQNGLERTVTVHTANGDILAHYEGKIDIEDNDGGYVIFDLDGKRYMYYNCFVESIADIK